MQNILTLKKEFILLITGLLLVILAMNASYISRRVLSSKGSELSAQAIATPTPDPSKDFNSLDSSVAFTLPPSWKKVDHIDSAAGTNTYIKLTSPDFQAPDPVNLQSGVGIVINRVYDLKAQDTLNNKLNAQYNFDTYNVTPLEIGGQNAMTMHKDNSGHFRIIYVATHTHLWEITITSKSLEDEQRYQSDINTFLTSIKFI